MSDEKITRVEVTPRGAAVDAAYRALKPGTDVRDRHAWAEAIAAAVDAYERERVVAIAHLLRPAPGDTVLFHVRGRMDAEQHDEFLRSLEPLRKQHPGVLFTASDAIDEISVVRPLTEQADGRTGLERLREAAQGLPDVEVVSTGKFTDRGLSDGQR